MNGASTDKISSLLQRLQTAGPANFNALLSFKRKLIAELGIDQAFAFYRTLKLPNSDQITLARIESQHAYAKACGTSFVEIAPAGESFVVRPPAIIGEGRSRALANTARSLYIACLADARVRSRSGVIQVGDLALLDYQGPELDTFHPEFDLDPAIFQATYPLAWLIEPLASSNELEFDAAFTLMGLNTGAFGDWMMYFLPKYIAGDLSGMLPKVPVLVPELPEKIFQCLRLMLPSDTEIVQLPCFATARVRQLWCVPNLSGAEIRETLDEPIDYGGFAPPPARFAPITREIARRAGQHLVETPGPEQVFLARRGSGWRKLLNQTEISAIAAAHGFVIAFPEELTFPEQVALVRDARFIIAPEGSAIFLCYFARQQPKLCILNHTLLEWPTVYNSLLSGAGIEITILTGPITREYGPHSIDSDYRIDEAVFSKFLTESFLRLAGGDRYLVDLPSARDPVGTLSKSAYESAVSSHRNEIAPDLRRLDFAIRDTTEPVSATNLAGPRVSLGRVWPIKLSVLLLAYNQVKFIAQALDSVLMQETDFDFEILAVDDASSDGTQTVLQEYAVRYPDRIRLMLNDTNFGSERETFLHSFQKVKGEYVALLDGDDYWIDSAKLQKQVTFMDNNQGYSLCSHNNIMKNEWTQTERLKFDILDDMTVPIEMLIEGCIYQTSSVLYRNGLISVWPEYFNTFAFSDWPLEILLAERGRMRLLADVMSVYRIHSGGMWSQQYRDRSAHAGPNVEAWKEIVRFWQALNIHFEYAYDDEIQRWIKEKISEFPEIRSVL